MHPIEITGLERWLWKNIFKDNVITKKFRTTHGWRKGYKVKDSVCGEFPNAHGVHGWGWQSCPESAMFRIPNLTCREYVDAMLDRCRKHPDVYRISFRYANKRKYFVVEAELMTNKYTKSAKADTKALAIGMLARALFEK